LTIAAPDWEEGDSLPELVSSYGIELGDDFLLFDPLGSGRAGARRRRQSSP